MNQQQIDAYRSWLQERHRTFLAEAAQVSNPYSNAWLNRADAAQQAYRAALEKFDELTRPVPIVDWGPAGGTTPTLTEAEAVRRAFPSAAGGLP